MHIFTCTLANRHGKLYIIIFAISRRVESPTLSPDPNPADVAVFTMKRPFLEKNALKKNSA